MQDDVYRLEKYGGWKLEAILHVRLEEWLVDVKAFGEAPLISQHVGSGLQKPNGRLAHLNATYCGEMRDAAL